MNIARSDNCTIFTAKLLCGDSIMAVRYSDNTTERTRFDSAGNETQLSKSEFDVLLGAVDWTGAEWRSYLDEFEPLSLMAPKYSYESRNLREELIAIIKKKLELGTGESSPDDANASDPPGSWRSDLDALVATGTAVQHYLNAYGLDDGFFGTEDEGPFAGYPPIEQYDEGLTRELGQLAGDVNIAVNPSRYVSKNCPFPSLDTSTRENRFLFDPLPTIDHWSLVDDGTITYKMEDGTFRSGHDLTRCYMAPDVWFDMWCEDHEVAVRIPGEGKPAKQTRQLYVCELLAPNAKAPIAGMEAPIWFAFNWFDQDSLIPKGVLRFYPKDSAHQAWSWAANWWVNAAYRYV